MSAGFKLRHLFLLQQLTVKLQIVTIK